MQFFPLIAATNCSMCAAHVARTKKGAFVAVPGRGSSAFRLQIANERKSIKLFALFALSFQKEKDWQKYEMIMQILEGLRRGRG